MIFIQCQKMVFFPFHCVLHISAWFGKLEFFFLIFTFIEKLYPHVCFTMPASLQALGWRIAIRAKVDQKGRVIFLYQVTKSKSKSPDSHIKRELKIHCEPGS